MEVDQLRRQNPSEGWTDGRCRRWNLSGDRSRDRAVDQRRRQNSSRGGQRNLSGGQAGGQTDSQAGGRL